MMPVLPIILTPCFCREKSSLFFLYFDCSNSSAQASFMSSHLFLMSGAAKCRDRISWSPLLTTFSKIGSWPFSSNSSFYNVKVINFIQFSKDKKIEHHFYVYVMTKLSILWQLYLMVFVFVSCINKILSIISWGCRWCMFLYPLHYSLVVEICNTGESYGVK